MNGDVPASMGPVNDVDDTNWKIAGLADFDGDGDRAIASAGAVNRVEDLTWSIVGTGKFNADGKEDIVWQNSVTNEVYLYLMDGRTILTVGEVRTVADGWQVAGAGDFNFDGYSDLLFRHQETGGTWMWLMNGFTVVGEGSVELPPDADLVGVGDFGKDSWQMTGDNDDLLVRDRLSGALQVYFMSANAVTGITTLALVEDLNWKVAAVGDYNGDRISDVLWRHAKQSPA